MNPPAYRYLRGYTLDPGFSTRLDTARINDGVYRIPFEKLKPGPSGDYIEVVDFDPASGCWYEPVDLSCEEVATQNGLAPSEGNPQFHQQFVYAVAMQTIAHFERALGRKIVWSERSYSEVPRRAGESHQANDLRRYVDKLRIYPHALRDANAYYDPQKKAVLFGYFDAADQIQGANNPGGLVFTCLSPDIVAHEMTHAILDSIHPRYMEDTNLDVAAFHEGFADIVALLQRFTFRNLVEDQIFASAGRMDRYTVFGELATQFGEALEGNRGALRSMIGRWNEKGKWVPIKPSPSDYTDNTECHDRGAVLVATVFDAFNRIYSFRTRDLIRIATQGTGVLPEGSISRDLVGRLATEASEIAKRLLHICIRALDYSPPLDPWFSDYLRAMITADLDIAPEDEGGYRIALIEAFRARGILPYNMTTLSVESLRWDRPSFSDPEADILEKLAGPIRAMVREMTQTKDRDELYKLSKVAQGTLGKLLNDEKAQLFPSKEIKKNFLKKLGMTSLLAKNIFGPRGPELRFTRKAQGEAVPKIEVHTVRPAFRIGREGRQVEQVLITFTQSIHVLVGDDSTGLWDMAFRGGCTVLLSFGKEVKVDYIIRKDIASDDRFRSQRDYLNGDGEDAEAASASLYADSRRTMKMNFARLHNHL